MGPVARLEPLTASVAVPDVDSGELPSTVEPSAKTIVPAGDAVPEAGLTVAVICVVPLAAMPAGLAETDIAVATGGAVTTTVSAAIEVVKPAAPEYVAVIVFAPVARLVPFTGRVAVSTPAASERVPRPRTVLPSVKLTVPDGSPAPVAGFTVAVNTVVPDCAIEVGLAETRVVVEIAGAVTVTLTAAEVEPVKVEFPA